MTEVKPLLAQYNQFKAEYPDCVIFVQVGNFYRVYMQDAHIASKVLNLNVIAANLGEGSIPACGVPASTVKGHAQKLFDNGYSVVICDQTNETLNGIKQRKVSEVLKQDNISLTAIIEQEEYNHFVEIFTTKQANKKAKEAEYEKHNNVMNILDELQTLDLNEVPPTEAWALLYHWKRTFCE